MFLRRIALGIASLALTLTGAAVVAPAANAASYPATCHLASVYHAYSIKGVTFTLRSVVNYRHRPDTNYTWVWFELDHVKSTGATHKGTVSAYYQRQGHALAGRQKINYTASKTKSRNYTGDFGGKSYTYYGQNFRVVIHVPGHGTAYGPWVKSGSGPICGDIGIT